MIGTGGGVVVGVEVAYKSEINMVRGGRRKEEEEWHFRSKFGQLLSNIIQKCELYLCNIIHYYLRSVAGYVLQVDMQISYQIRHIKNTLLHYLYQ